MPKQDAKSPAIQMVTAGTIILAVIIELTSMAEVTESHGIDDLQIQQGMVKFNISCARCHASRGVGTLKGPPLVHKIYAPHRHSDVVFRSAIDGVKSHHWDMGDMPKVKGLTDEDVSDIIKYVRLLQRQACIM
jgi:mono/diheme cytochrome c family protein